MAQLKYTGTPFESTDKKLMIIDGHSLAFRAYFAVPSSLRAPDGRPTNAIQGFLSMLMNYLEFIRPDALICAFDKGRPKWRLELLPEYKAQREETDKDLVAQFKPLQDLLREALNIPVIMQEGLEGDDILGTLSTQAREAGYKTYLVTGDRDNFQLINDDVRLIYPSKGTSSIDIFDADAVFKKFGVYPYQIPCFYGMKGDSSDNIPGVPGIGEKTGAKLLQNYDKLEGIYEHIDELKGKVKENLENNKDQAFLSRQIATIKTDADLSLDLEAASFPQFKPDQMYEVFTDLGLSSMYKRYVNYADLSTEEFDEKSKLSFPKIVKKDQDALSSLQRAFASSAPIAVNYRSDGAAGQLFDSGVLYAYCNQEFLIFEQDAKETLSQIIKRAHYVAYDVKELWHQLYPEDSSLDPSLELSEFWYGRADDIQIMAYLLDSNKSSYDLNALVEYYLQKTPPSEEELEQQGICQEQYECLALALLQPVLIEKLKEDDSYDLYKKMEMPLIVSLMEIERNGMKLDVNELAKQSQEAQEILGKLEKDIYELAGQSFNIHSPKQLSKVLYEDLDLPKPKKTRTGYSTNANYLEKIAHEHPIIEKVIEYREYSKLQSSYLEALPKLILGDGRIHTCLNQTVAATGRLSSSNPNLQNIPVKTEHGRRIRKAFTVEAGNIFVSVDYSQIELRLLAHLSQDPDLIAAFLEGEDFHRETAAKIFQVPPAEVSSMMRARAKAVNFGIIYGQQAYGLSTALDIGFSEAQEMIDKYFKAYPQVANYLEQVKHRAKEQGWIETMFGRKRHIPELKSAQKNVYLLGERTAMNHPMQGSAADIIKLAMIEVQRKLAASGLSAKMLIQVHDELDFECPKSELEDLSALVKEAMESVVELSVPLIAEVSYADNWADAK